MKSCIAQTVYNTQGKAELGYQTSLEGLNLAQESGDATSKAEAYVHHGVSCFLKGFIDESERHLVNGANYCQKIDYASGVLANQYLGMIYSEKKQYRKSRNCFAEAISILENRGGWESVVHIIKIALTLIKAEQHEKDINIELLYRYMDENKIKALEGPMALRISQILLKIDEPNIQIAENLLQKAIWADQKNGQRWNLSMDYITYAELHKRKNKNMEAKKSFSQAIENFYECGANGWAEKYEKELAEL